MTTVRVYFLSFALVAALAASSCLDPGPNAADVGSSDLLDSTVTAPTDGLRDDDEASLPCIALSPDSLSFGATLIDTRAEIRFEIASCAARPLEITGIGLTADTPETFSFVTGPLEVTASGRTVLSPGDPPIVLQPAQTVAVTVAYSPSSTSALGVDEQPILDTGRVFVHSNAIREEEFVSLTGFGVDCDCPTATIKVAEGEEVIPQTRLHLTGSQSWAPNRPIAEYAWTVEQPPGSRSLFLPSASVPDPTFEVNVAGRYEFRLVVTDSSGTVSPIQAIYAVLVTPDAAMHIELLWDTPNDADQSDENVGADLDLHFVHPLADGGFDGDGDGISDGWFDIPFDCFWVNDAPNWGSINSSADDNPTLDRDDTDGAGPENLNLALPEMGATYKIGVHYWQDRGFGPSFATVRVYVYGSLEFEASDVKLQDSDMWAVARVAWPPTDPPELIRVCAGSTTSCDTDADCGGTACGLHIVPEYHHPEFFQP